MPANFGIILMHLLNIAASYYLGYFELAALCAWVLPNYKEAGVELIVKVESEAGRKLARH